MKIVVDGALNKEKNTELVEKYGEGQVEVAAMWDIRAASAPKSGQADHYFDPYQTGAGGALGMAIATNGMDKCITAVMIGRVLGDSGILKAIRNKKKAFGFVPEAAAGVIPVIMKEVLKRIRS